MGFRADHRRSTRLPGMQMAEGIPTRGIAMQQHKGNESRYAGVQSRGGDSKKGVREPRGAGGPQRVGWFRFYFDDDRWEWSPQVEKMHGYLPGSVAPTTEMVLANKHPDDYRYIADTLDLIRRTRQPFSSRHRIIDAEGRIHHVVVGDLLRNGPKDRAGLPIPWVAQPLGNQREHHFGHRRGRFPCPTG
jgi:hypothetical protein